VKHHDITLKKAQTNAANSVCLHKSSQWWRYNDLLC